MALPQPPKGLVSRPNVRVDAGLMAFWTPGQLTLRSKCTELAMIDKLDNRQGLVVLALASFFEVADRSGTLLKPSNAVSGTSRPRPGTKVGK